MTDTPIPAPAEARPELRADPPQLRRSNPLEVRNATSGLVHRVTRVGQMIGGIWRTKPAEAEAAAALLEIAEQALALRRLLLTPDPSTETPTP